MSRKSQSGTKRESRNRVVSTGHQPLHFRSEAEEAAWWATNQDYIASLLEKHGRPTKGRSVEPSRIVTIRLYERDIELARRIAKDKGIRYQSYIKMLLHEALTREAGQEQPDRGREAAEPPYMRWAGAANCLPADLSSRKGYSTK